jgi:hypothetical protein
MDLLPRQPGNVQHLSVERVSAVRDVWVDAHEASVVFQVELRKIGEGIDGMGELESVSTSTHDILSGAFDVLLSGSCS